MWEVTATAKGDLSQGNAWWVGGHASLVLCATHMQYIVHVTQHLIGISSYGGGSYCTFCGGICGVVSFCDEAATILQKYETLSQCKYTLRIYHSFYPYQRQGPYSTKKELLRFLPEVYMKCDFRSPPPHLGMLVFFFPVNIVRKLRR